MADGVVQQSEARGWPKDWIPAQRAGDIKDMGGAVLFLTSRAGSYVNGNVLIIDGGRVSIVPATY